MGRMRGCEAFLNEITVSWHLGHPVILLDGEGINLVQINSLGLQAFYVLRRLGLSLFFLAPRGWEAVEVGRSVSPLDAAKKHLGSKDLCGSPYVNLF